MGKQVTKKTNANRRAFLANVLLTLAVVGIAMGGIYAKYFREMGQETGAIRAREFFFTSDLLTESNPEYSRPDTSVTFELRNYDAANELKWAEDDIQYTVTVVDDTPSDPSDDAVVTTSRGTLSKGDKRVATITLSNLQAGRTYEVTAVGQAGYVKTLKATFTVQAQKVYKSLEKDDNRLYLTIRTENVKGDAVFTIPAGLIPNKTETKGALNDANNYQSGVFIALSDYVDNKRFNNTADTSQKYSFIIDDTEQTYTIADFNGTNGEITVGGVIAIEETP